MAGVGYASPPSFQARWFRFGLGISGVSYDNAC